MKVTLPTENQSQAAELLKNLANPHRLQILCALAEGELKVGDLNERVALSQSALSQHLAKLRHNGLVKTRKDGLEVYYQIHPGPALEIIAILRSYFCADS